MKLRLVKKQLAANTETFAPELLITIAIPLELMVDNAALHGMDEVYETIGAEFARMLKTAEGVK